MTRPEQRPDPLLHLALGGLSLAVLLAAFVLQVDSDVAVRVPGFGRLPETCWFRLSTGLACPGCGLTRSFISIAHGELQRAWQFNPVGPLFFALIAGQIPYRAWQYSRIQRGLGEFHWRPWEWLPLYAVFILLLGQWMWRMSPLAAWGSS